MHHIFGVSLYVVHISKIGSQSLWQLSLSCLCPSLGELWWILLGLSDPQWPLYYPQELWEHVYWIWQWENRKNWIDSKNKSFCGIEWMTPCDWGFVPNTQVRLHGGQWNPWLSLTKEVHWTWHYVDMCNGCLTLQCGHWCPGYYALDDGQVKRGMGLIIPHMPTGTEVCTH